MIVTETKSLRVMYARCRVNSSELELERSARQQVLRQHLGRSTARAFNSPAQGLACYTAINCESFETVARKSPDRPKCRTHCNCYTSRPESTRTIVLRRILKKITIPISRPILQRERAN